MTLAEIRRSRECWERLDNKIIGEMHCVGSVFDEHENENPGWKRPIVGAGHLTVDGSPYCHNYDNTRVVIPVAKASPQPQKSLPLTGITKWLVNSPKKIMSIFGSSSKPPELPVPKFRAGDELMASVLWIVWKTVIPGNVFLLPGEAFMHYRS